MVQMATYSLFFWAMVLAACLLGLPPLAVVITGVLSAVNPIIVHVNTHFWLDGPLVAFCVLSLALFIRASDKKSFLMAAAAGVVLGLASLIKITAFLVMPGFALLSLVLLARPKFKAFIGLSACLFAVALLVQLPWEIWQWMVLGTPFPGWAGKPSQALIASNDYVRYLTVVRPSWIYLTLLPKVMWAIVPALVFYAVTFKDEKVRWVGAAFILWIATVLIFHIVLGARGYSKVLRYVILAAPPAILLFSMTTAVIFRRFNEGGAGARRVYGFLLLVAAAAVLLEAAAGVKSTDLYAIDLIFPLFGGL